MTAGGVGRRLTVITRADCELCEQMAEELASLRELQPLPEVGALDVDSDPALQRRWGLKVPVLQLDGSMVCAGRLDTPELLRLLRL